MTIPTLSTLPVAPARTDPPATFVTRADAFLAAIVTFQGEMNTSIGAMNTDIAQVNADAIAAAASASSAASSATAAANAAGASLWVSGQAYAEGDAAISGVNYQTYRAETATSGTTDPSLDANWTAISGTFPDQTGNAGEYLTTDGTNVSWAAVDALPNQTGNAGLYLTTDGSVASWDLVSAGGTTTATASGSISAGDPLVVNSDGTVSVISSSEYSYYSQTQFMLQSFGSMPYSTNNTANILSQMAAYDKKRNMYLWLNSGGFFNGYANFYGIQMWSVSSDEYHQPVIRNQMITQRNESSNYFTPTAMAVDYINSKWVCWGYYSSSTSTPRIITGTYNDYGMNYDSYSTQPQADPFSFNKACGAAFDEVSGDFIAIGLVSAKLNIKSGYTRAAPTGRGLILRATSVIDSVTNNDDKQYMANMYWHQPTRQAIIVYNKNSTSLYCRVATYNGTSFTLGTEQTIGSSIQNSNGANPIVYYHDDQDCFIFAYLNTSGYPTLRPATLSGTTFTFKTAVTPMSINGNTRDWGSCQMSNSKIFTSANIYFAISTMSNQQIVSSTGDHNTSITNLESIQTTGGNIYYLKSSGTIIYTNTSNRDFALGTFYSSNYKGNNFIGFADNNYTNGQTATITVTSGVNSQQSNMVIGKDYYVDIHGNMTDGRAGPKVGIAKSATELLVK